MTQTPTNFKEKVELLAEDYDVIETEENGIKKVIIQGLAITFEKPTRNRVSYTYESGTRTHTSLIKKPFLDSHIDKSIHKNPPFGHVIETWIDKNPKNGLPALFYKVDIDPMEETFIRKMKRGDIPGVSVQVLVDSVIDKQDMYGDYIQANIREFLELSAVLIPGDGDTTMRLVESFNNLKSNYKEDLTTSDGNAVINLGGVLSKRKTIRKDPETEEQKSKSKIFEPDPTVDVEDDSSKSNKYLIGKKMEENKTNTSDKTYEERFNKIESMLEKMSTVMEGLAEGQPEDDKKGKLSGSEKDPKNVNQEDGVGIKKIESMIRQVLKEELKGAPERKTGHEQKDIGPDKTNSIPQTVQPSNGKAPSGGVIYGDDKLAEDEAKDAEGKANKPKSDYNKPNVQKNSLDEAKTLIEKAKSIMKEFAKGKDVFDGQPGRTEDEPHKMDDAKPKKGDSGFEEKCEKEMSDDKKDDKKEDKKDPMTKMYESLQDEIKKESTNRKSVISAPISENLNGNTIKDSIKEYLTKTNLNGLINNK